MAGTGRLGWGGGLGGGSGAFWGRERSSCGGAGAGWQGGGWRGGRGRQGAGWGVRRDREEADRQPAVGRPLRDGESSQFPDTFASPQGARSLAPQSPVGGGGAGAVARIWAFRDREPERGLCPPVPRRVGGACAVALTVAAVRVPSGARRAAHRLASAAGPWRNRIWIKLRPPISMWRRRGCRAEGTLGGPRVRPRGERAPSRAGPVRRRRREWRRQGAAVGPGDPATLLALTSQTPCIRGTVSATRIGPCPSRCRPELGRPRRHPVGETPPSSGARRAKTLCAAGRLPGLGHGRGSPLPCPRPWPPVTVTPWVLSGAPPAVLAQSHSTGGLSRGARGEPDCTRALAKGPRGLKGLGEGTAAPPSLPLHAFSLMPPGALWRPHQGARGASQTPSPPP